MGPPFRRAVPRPEALASHTDSDQSFWTPREVSIVDIPREMNRPFDGSFCSVAPSGGGGSVLAPSVDVKATICDRTFSNSLFLKRFFNGRRFAIGNLVINFIVPI